jgi:hypothetical protein
MLHGSVVVVAAGVVVFAVSVAVTVGETAEVAPSAAAEQLRVEVWPPEALQLKAGPGPEFVSDV